MGQCPTPLGVAHLAAGARRDESCSRVGAAHPCGVPDGATSRARGNWRRGPWARGIAGVGGRRRRRCLLKGPRSKWRQGGRSRMAPERTLEQLRFSLVPRTAHMGPVTVSRPVGGILWRRSAPVAIHLCGPPGDRRRVPAGRAARVPCSALLRVGFTKPSGSPRTLVRSYRTVSPLPVRPRFRDRHRRSALCGTVLRVAPTGCWPAPCPVESRPSSTRSRFRTKPCRGHPAGSPSPSVCQVVRRDGKGEQPGHLGWRVSGGAGGHRD